MNKKTSVKDPAAERRSGIKNPCLRQTVSAAGKGALTKSKQFLNIFGI